MAYVGLARPVVARYTGVNNYEEAFIFGKAVKIEVNVNYEDTGDYKDINDTEEEQVFKDADIKLSVTNIESSEENILFGHLLQGDEVISSDSDKSNYIGLGWISVIKTGGQRRYAAIWLTKVKLYEEGQNHETKGDSIEYIVPEASGKVYTDDDGTWRRKRSFGTKKEAEEWLNQIAGLEREVF